MSNNKEYYRHACYTNIINADKIYKELKDKGAININMSQHRELVIVDCELPLIKNKVDGN